MRGKLIAGAAVAGVAGLMPAVQAVPLTFDLRLTSDLGSGLKSATVSQGQVVSLDLYAIITNGDGTKTNDGFLGTHGSFVSTSGVLGTFRADNGGVTGPGVNNVTPFKGTVANSGRSSDLDGDTDLDVGSTANGSLSPFPWFSAQSDLNTSPQLGTGGAGNQEFLIGQITFTVGAGGGNTSLNYIPRLNTTGSVTAQRTNTFRVDGVDWAVRGDGTGVKNTTTAVTNAIDIGPSVVLSVPEPASLGMLAIGAAALLRRRKA